MSISWTVNVSLPCMQELLNALEDRALIARSTGNTSEKLRERIRLSLEAIEQGLDKKDGISLPKPVVQKVLDYAKQQDPTEAQLNKVIQDFYHVKVNFTQWVTPQGASC